MIFHRYTWRTATRELVFILAAVITCIPFYLLIVGSLKTTGDAYVSPLSVPLDPNWDSYSDAWSAAQSTGTLGHALLNSLIITVSSVAILIAVGSTAAYVLARRTSRMSTVLYVVFVVGLIFPFQLSLIPLYVLLNEVGLLGSYLGVILVMVGMNMPLTIFLYTGFVRTVSPDYEEAAQVDGAGMMRIWISIIFPLLRPITATVATLNGLLIWNEFFVPLVFLGPSSDKAPVPVAIYALVGEYISRWNLIFAGVAIALAPVLLFYFFSQRHLVRGFTGGIKG